MGPQKVENMEDCRRTRSQGPPSLPEGTELIQWDSLQDPVRIKRENAEAHRLARETNTVIDVIERTAEEQRDLASNQHTTTIYCRSASIGRDSHQNKQEQGGQVSVTPKASEIPPTQTDESNPPQLKHNTNEISSKEHDEVTDLVAMEEGARAQMP